MKSSIASPPAPGLSGVESSAGWEGAGDAALALAAGTPDRAGREAFVEIVRRHQTAVCAVAWSVTGRVGLTDDIAQETFFKAWKQIATLRDPAKLKAWLTRIAHDCAVDALRREKPHAPLDDPASGPRLAAAACCSSASPDKAAADAEEEALVWASLAALPENLRTPLVLYYREGQSVAAVAAAMDLSEDAVKQRLSRGRQALKSAVESRVETVLGRVRPSALLVVTIAAGIGLLPGPAAAAAVAAAAVAAVAAVAAGVASGALAAGSVGSAGLVGSAGGGVAAATTGAGAAGIGAGISTFMTATSWLAAAITLAAFLPFGWKARGLAVVSSPANVPPSQSAPGLSGDPFADYPDSKLLAAWRQLHAKHGSDAAAMPVLYGLIEAEPDAFRRRALGIALMSEWAAVDPEGAFQILWSEKKNTDHAALMMREWLKRAPDQAAAHLLTNLGGAAILAGALTKDLAELAPGHFIAVLSALPPPPPPLEDSYVHNAPPEPSREDFEIFARHDFQAAMEALPLLKGKVLAGARTTVATLMAEKNPASAMEWARGLGTKEERKAAGETVIRLWAESNPAAALAGLDPVSDDPQLATLILDAAANKDLAAALRLKEEHAGKFTPYSWYSFSYPLTRKFETDPLGTLTFLSDQASGTGKKLMEYLDPGELKPELAPAVWDWITARKSDSLAQDLCAKLITQAFWRNPKEGLERLKTLPEELLTAQSMDPKTLMSQMTGAQVEDLLRASPAGARLPLLQAAFGSPVRDALPDLPLWSQRLQELPVVLQGGAAGEFAKSLVYHDPLLAVKFADSIPDGVARHAAYYELTGYWSHFSPYEASAWVDTLPPGTGRDVATVSLITNLSPGDIDSGLTWAASIGSADKRLDALKEFTRRVSEDYPSKIPDLLSSPILSQTDREALGAALSKANPSK
ncbi:MAG: sigma-70 family RNA polymerase sigma factor [Verrucomicrobiota bacterium]